MRFGPGNREFESKDHIIRTFFSVLPNGGGSVVNPNPAVDGKHAVLVDRFKKSRAATFKPQHWKGDVFLHGVVSSALAVRFQVIIRDLVLIQALMAVQAWMVTDGRDIRCGSRSARGP